VIVDRAVDLNRVVAVVASRHGHAGRARVPHFDVEVGVGAGEVLEAAVDRRQRLDLLRGDGRLRAGVVRVDDLVGAGRTVTVSVTAASFMRTGTSAVSPR